MSDITPWSCPWTTMRPPRGTSEGSRETRPPSVGHSPASRSHSSAQAASIASGASLREAAVKSAEGDMGEKLPPYRIPRTRMFTRKP
jgi:hypothetical protein